MFSRVGFDIAIGNCLLQSLVQDAMEIADGLGRKPLFCQGVVITLNGMRVASVYGLDLLPVHGGVDRHFCADYLKDGVLL